MKNKVNQRKIRHLRVKKNINKNCPRLGVFRSSKHIYAQIIDQSKGHIMAEASDLKINQKKTGKEKKNNLEKAFEVGESLAQKATKKNIKQVIFDRAGYKYHGRIKALAEGARKGGLVF